MCHRSSSGDFDEQAAWRTTVLSVAIWTETSPEMNDNPNVIGFLTHGLFFGLGTSLFAHGHSDLAHATAYCVDTRIPSRHQDTESGQGETVLSRLGSREWEQLRVVCYS